MEFGIDKKELTPTLIASKDREVLLFKIAAELDLG